MLKILNRLKKKLLSRVQNEFFYYDKAVCCKYYVQLLIQGMCTRFHKKLISYKCMPFVDCLMVIARIVN